MGGDVIPSISNRGACQRVIGKTRLLTASFSHYWLEAPASASVSEIDARRRRPNRRDAEFSVQRCGIAIASWTQ